MLKLSVKPVLLFCLLVASVWQSSCTKPPEPELLEFKIVDELPHDRSAYTQGLFFVEDQLYESTGQYGRSQLLKVELQSGRSLQTRDLDARIFGEGSTYLNGQIYVLSWENEVCRVFDLETFKLIKEFSYQGEGWGLATDGESLIMSNGSAELVFRDPTTFAITRTITVTDASGPMVDLNELEYVEGFIYSNIWHQDIIVKISPDTGRVVGLMDLGALMRPRPKDEQAVLNGIAYRKSDQLFYLTGKLWSKLYAIQITEPEQP